MTAIDKMNWATELSIGNKNIDKDHEKLIEIYNDLVDLIVLNQSREEFAKILSKMTDYTLKHFKKEEAYMKQFKYPKLKEHRKLHNDYRYKVAMYNVDLLGTNPPNPQEIIDYLGKWWRNHILNNDKQYENFKKESGLDAEYKEF